MANALAKNISDISKGCSLPSFCNAKSKQEAELINFKTGRTYSHNEPFSLEELQAALSGCSNTAQGEDRICFQMLKYSHINSQEFLLCLYNDVFIQESYPEVWNIAIDLPFLKPGKDPHDPNSY